MLMSKPKKVWKGLEARLPSAPPLKSSDVTVWIFLKQFEPVIIRIISVDKAKSRKGEAKCALYKLLVLWVPNVYLFGRARGLFGEWRRRKKEGKKIYLMFYGLIKRKPLLSLDLEKTSINIEMKARNWSRRR